MFREARKIDELGQVQLVSVDELEKKLKHTVSVKKKMFLCPDCCEYVAFVYCKKKNSYFMHEKSDGTRKCEIYVKRVNSSQTYTPYERAGLPLYLLKIDGSFCISIGFYPISKQTIDAAVVNKLFLTICTGKGMKITTKYINEESFSSDTTSFVQIDKVSNKYQLEFSGKKPPTEILKKWAGEIEGIESKGSFFKYNEYGGMKVRRSETITVGSNYYFVCKYDPAEFIDGVVSYKVGEINLINDIWEKSTFSVYVIGFTVITQRNRSFCLDHYGVLLAYDTPDLIPLWPPCNRKEQLYIYEYNQTARFLLKTSQQSEKNLFIYPEKPAMIENLDEKRAIASLQIDEIERLVSIGRLNNIFTFAIVARESEEMIYNSEVIAEDDKFKTYTTGEYTELPYKNRIRVKSKFKCTIYVYYIDDLEYLRYVNGSIWLDNIKYGNIIKVFHGLDLVFELKFKRITKDENKELEKSLTKELPYYIGNEVLTPISFKYILPRLIDSPILYDYVKKAIKTGYINKTAMYRILRNIFQRD
ncbi:MAG TPA: hypothetical protein GX505_03070 [Clostridiales bacterium]|nr:hypothetical protein [Clostridiales bacterium]